MRQYQNKAKRSRARTFAIINLEEQALHILEVICREKINSAMTIILKNKLFINAPKVVKINCY